jgi:cell division protein FtsZ
MDDSYDEMVQLEYLQNSNAPRPAAERQILNAPRTLNAAELHAELHGPSGKVQPDMESKAFERGLQLGFSLAQHLPAIPLSDPESEEPVQQGLSPCTIKLVGVGGGGGNTLNRVASLDLGVERESCIEYIACNTDAQALEQSLGSSIIQIGSQARGLGAGGKPHVGEASALESSPEINAAVRDADMVFVTAGMGGGTGSGAAPVVANLARAAGCLTIGVVTTPFAFEGRVRAEQAEAAIKRFEAQTDILIVVSNDRLLEIVPEDVPIEEAFLMADEIMRQGIIGLADIVIKPGLINVDFADVRAVMTAAGKALMGIGRGFGPTRARDAAMAAVSSPLLDFPIAEAKGVVFTITGNAEMSLTEVNEVATLISDMVSDDANIIFGTSVDESFGDEISVTLVATSLPGGEGQLQETAQPNVIEARVVHNGARRPAASSAYYKAR